MNDIDFPHGWLVYSVPRYMARKAFMEYTGRLAHMKDICLN